MAGPSPAITVVMGIENWSGLIQSVGIEPDHIVYTEVISRIVALHIVNQISMMFSHATGTSGGSCSMMSSAGRISAVYWATGSGC